MSLPQLSSPPSENFPTIPFSVPWLRSLRTALGREGNRPVLMCGLPLPDWQISHIEDQIRHLQDRLIPSIDRREIAVELAKLLACFPSQAQSDSPANLRMEGYFEALSGVPAWAVAEARGRILRAEITLGHNFCPTPPELARAVKLVVQPVRADLDSLRRILAAATSQDVTVAERDRVAAGWRKLKVDLSEVRT